MPSFSKGLETSKTSLNYSANLRKFTIAIIILALLVTQYVVLQYGSEKVISSILNLRLCSFIDVFKECFLVQLKNK